jgi:hypothetical protein
MFPTLRDYEVREEQYRDLFRESVFERLVQQVKGRKRRRLQVAKAEQHEPGRPHVWCVPTGLGAACVAV